MNIWDEERKLLINKMVEQREQYLFKFGLDPDYVIIPIHYKALLQHDKNYFAGCFDTFYGMQIIESKNCKTIYDIMVY